MFLTFVSLVNEFFVHISIHLHFVIRYCVLHSVVLLAIVPHVVTTSVTFLPTAHRPRSPRQNSLGGASSGASTVSSPQTGMTPVDSVATPMTTGSPIAASPASNLAATPSAEGNLNSLLRQKTDRNFWCFRDFRCLDGWMFVAKFCSVLLRWSFTFCQRLIDHCLCPQPKSHGCKRPDRTLPLPTKRTLNLWSRPPA